MVILAASVPPAHSTSSAPVKTGASCARTPTVSICCDPENLAAIKAALSPTEWEADAPYCTFQIPYLGKRIVTKGLRSYGVVTKLSLKKAVSGTGIAYSQVQFAIAERLNPEITEIMKKYGEQMRPVTRKIELQDWNADADQSGGSSLPIVDMETGEVMEPLK